MRDSGALTLTWRAPWSWWGGKFYFGLLFFTIIHRCVSVSSWASEGLRLHDLCTPVYLLLKVSSNTLRHHRQCMAGWHYLCLLSAILRMSQVLVNFADNSRARPHSCSSDQAWSGPKALANRSATFPTLMGAGPSLRLPFSGSWGVGLVLLFCSRCKRSFHSSKVSGIHPAHRNTQAPYMKCENYKNTAK